MDTVFYLWLARVVFRALPILLRTLKINGDLEQLFNILAEPIPPTTELDDPDKVVAALRRNPHIAALAKSLDPTIGEAKETQV